MLNRFYYFFYKKTLICFLIFNISFLLFTEDIKFFFTSSLNGEIFGCKCPKEHKAGLARILTLIKKYKSNYKNVLFLDSGDFCAVYKNKDISNLLFNFYTKNYTIVSVGDQDLANYIFNYPDNSFFISSNIKIRNKEVFKNYKIININGIKIGFFSLIEPNVIKFYKELDKIVKIEDPLNISKIVINKLKYENCDLIVLVSHLGLENDKKLVSSIEGIDIIISGHTQEFYEMPIIINNSYIYTGGSNGVRIGIIEISIESGKRKFNNYFENINYDLIEPDNDMQNILDEFKKNIKNKNSNILFE